MNDVFLHLKGNFSLNVGCADPYVVVSYSFSLQAFPESSCGRPLFDSDCQQ